MDKETGKAARSAYWQKDNRKCRICCRRKRRNSGKDMNLCLNGSNLAGKTLVAFEKLYYGDKLYAVHTDLGR